MKQFFISVAVIAACGFTSRIIDDKATATVNQEQGLYLFVESTPSAKYEFLGSVNAGMQIWSNQYENIKASLLKRVKKDFPQANGIILHFTGGAKASKADAIRFKE